MRSAHDYGCLAPIVNILDGMIGFSCKSVNKVFLVPVDMVHHMMRDITSFLYWVFVGDLVQSLVHLHRVCINNLTIYGLSQINTELIALV